MTQNTVHFEKGMSRRRFLKLTTLSGGALVLAACGGNSLSNANDSNENTAVSSTNTPEVVEQPTEAVASEAEAEVVVGDVVDYQLSSDEWEGAFGSVTFKLHEGKFNGQSVYFIRTDGSDPTFSEENGLVYVPLLNGGQAAAASLYLFSNGDNLPILSTSPSQEDFTSLFQIKEVTLNEDGLTLESAEAVEAAVADGTATVEEKPIYVNYPVVKWEDDELTVDTEKTGYLGTGQLIEPVNTADMTVTFKLHECYPGSRYIVTDTSASPMAPMMSIAASPPNQALVDSGATDEIWVFANGIEGSGVMGYQPAIFDNQAGEPAWSPFWDHFTLRWADEANARVLTSSAEARAALEAGEVELFNGTPDSHPNGFVVNCPVPVLAPNTFQT